MNAMKVPGFTAAASLPIMRGRNTGQHPQKAPGGYTEDIQTSVILPQLPGGNAPGRAGCLSDCVDQHPTWTGAQCRRICSDPGGTPGSGGGRPRDPSADAVCWAGYAVCSAIGFAAFRPDLWASCLFGGPCSCEAIRDDCLSH